MNFGKLTCNNEIFRLNTKTSLIGRTPSCHLIIDHRSISKEHALIDFIEKQQAILKDLNSLNGTYINNKKIQPGASVDLKENDKLSFGKEGSLYIFNFAPQQMMKTTENAIKEPLKTKDYKISVIENWKENETASNMTAEFQKNERSSVEEDFREKYDKEIKVLNETIFIKEEQLHKKENQIEFLKNENVSLQEELEKSSAKQKALELLASDLQRKLDNFQMELEEKNRIFKDLNQKDWVKSLQENNKELNALRKVILLKDQEIEEVKKQYKAILHNNRNMNYSASEKILDQQIKELLSAKKQLVEYENNSLECNKRWKSLLQENVQKEERIKGYGIQIDRQIENFKAIYSQFDQKIKELNDKFLSIIERDGEQDFEAGKFLVEQMTIIQDEKMELIMENEKLHKQLQEISLELQDHRNIMEKYQELFNPNEDKGQIIARLREKIEEMEDFVVEIKEKEGIPKLIELNEVVEILEKKILENNEIIENLKIKNTQNQSKRKTGENYPINEDNAIEFFSRLLQDKDKKIVFMSKEIELYEAKEKQRMGELEKLKIEVIPRKPDFESHREKISPPQKLPSFYRNAFENQNNYLSPDFNEITLMNENII